MHNYSASLSAPAVYCYGEPRSSDGYLKTRTGPSGPQYRGERRGEFPDDLAAINRKPLAQTPEFLLGFWFDRGAPTRPFAGEVNQPSLTATH